MRSAPRIPPERRVTLAAAYANGAEEYHRVRPGYPEEAFGWLLEPSGGRVGCAADIGAGTGKSTTGLRGRADAVVAVEPSTQMRAVLRRELPDVQVRAGSAEEVPLADGTADLILFGQSWHWAEGTAALQELERVLRSGGVLGILINQLDVRLPWVHRLTRIMHAGDVYDSRFRPKLGAAFGATEAAEFGFEQVLSREDVLALARTRSFWLRAGERARLRLEGNLRWYLDEHLDADPARIVLPYRCFAVRARRL